MFLFVLFFFFNDPATTEIYTLSLHDALPICEMPSLLILSWRVDLFIPSFAAAPFGPATTQLDCFKRSEEHTSELQSHSDLVCRLLLEKKKNNKINHTTQNRH